MSTFDLRRQDLVKPAPRPRLEETDLVLEIAAAFPGQTLSFGIDHKGPWATIGDITARAKPSAASALRAALRKAQEARQ